jgi:hypothetical protein
MLQHYNHITPIPFSDALSFVVEYEAATWISALTFPFNVHGFQLEWWTILSFFTSQNFMLTMCCLQCVGVVQVTQGGGCQMYWLIFRKLVVCFEVLTEREKKRKWEFQPDRFCLTLLRHWPRFLWQFFF